MFSHILVPVDGSELSVTAGLRVIDLAKMCNAKLTTVLVSPTYKRMTDEGFVAPLVNKDSDRWKEKMSERAKRILGQVGTKAEDAGLKCKQLHVFGDSPYLAIIDAANKNGCDAIVMGSHGLGGMKQFILGSETSRVLSHSKIPVLVYR